MFNRQDAVRGMDQVFFFNSDQIFLKLAGDTFPERNFLSNPLLIEAGTFFRYFRILLVSALVPSRNGVIDRQE